MFFHARVTDRSRHMQIDLKHHKVASPSLSEFARLPPVEEQPSAREDLLEPLGRVLLGTELGLLRAP